jgi:hypothetical protein
MKSVIIILFSLVLLSCRKENTDLGTAYPHLVGKWENIGISDDRVHVEFFKNGYIKVSKSTERMKNFKVNNYEILPPDYNKVRYFKKDKFGNAKEYNDFYVTFSNTPFNNYDTIDMYAGKHFFEYTNQSAFVPRFKKIQ